MIVSQFFKDFFVGYLSMLQETPKAKSEAPNQSSKAPNHIYLLSKEECPLN